ETEKFVALVCRYQRQVAEWLACLPERLRADDAAVERVSALLRGFAGEARLAELNADRPREARVTQEMLDAFREELAAASPGVDALPPVRVEPVEDLAGQKALQSVLDGLAPQQKALAKALEARHKYWLALLDKAEKTLRARQSAAFDAKAARAARRALLAADEKKEEKPTPRDEVLAALRQSVYFIAQAHWLLSRFPDSVFEDVAGLCRAVTVDEIEANDWSLTPGRYVGVAAAGEEEDEDFAERLRGIHEELAELNGKAAALAGRIAGNLERLFA
ncbi:MAG: hypothetical protein LBF51_07805, partial [Zoogloeaceae bacterium]|nr:hypothetical protein [Zoogloeaceae bacterium]